MISRKMSMLQHHWLFERLGRRALLCLIGYALINSIWVLAAEPAVVPGVVIDHSPATSGIYIGSPSLAVLPNGDYVASHDEFGPKSTEHSRAVSRIFQSQDRGSHWKQIATIDGAFWSTLFTHDGALYLIGPDKHHGNVLIRRSTDGGITWTSPTNSATGLLRGDGECRPPLARDGTSGAADRLGDQLPRRRVVHPRGRRLTQCDELDVQQFPAK
jgi:hypothetical protein